jgi:hypothetical protein
MTFSAAEGTLDQSFVEFHPETWLEIRSMSEQFSGWVFRGQHCFDWGLKTSLERAYLPGSNPHSLSGYEQSILRQFRRAAHHFIASPPDENDTLEWLSLIQHHGGPTRLLDFTKSLYVAAFYAVEDAEGDSAIWCLNPNALNKIVCQDGTVQEHIDSPIALFNNLFVGSIDRPATLILEPERLSERMIAQQGVFCVPCSLTSTVHKLLFQALNSECELSASRYEYDSAHLQLGTFPVAGRVMKIRIPKGIHAEIRQNLRLMNIHAGSLFPGLDGFARSLRWPS